MQLPLNNICFVLVLYRLLYLPLLLFSAKSDFTGTRKAPEGGLKEGGCSDGQCWSVTVLKVKSVLA